VLVHCANLLSCLLFSFLALVSGICSYLLLSQRTHILKLGADLCVYSIVFFLVPFPFLVPFASGTIDNQNMCEPRYVHMS